MNKQQLSFHGIESLLKVSDMLERVFESTPYSIKMVYSIETFLRTQSCGITDVYLAYKLHEDLQICKECKLVLKDGFSFTHILEFIDCYEKASKTVFNLFSAIDEEPNIENGLYPEICVLSQEFRKYLEESKDNLHIDIDESLLSSLGNLKPLGLGVKEDRCSIGYYHTQLSNAVSENLMRVWSFLPKDLESAEHLDCFYRLLNTVGTLYYVLLKKEEAEEVQ